MRNDSRPEAKSFSIFWKWALQYRTGAVFWKHQSNPCTIRAVVRTSLTCDPRGWRRLTPKSSAGRMPMFPLFVPKTRQGDLSPYTLRSSTAREGTWKSPPSPRTTLGVTQLSSSENGQTGCCADSHPGTFCCRCVEPGGGARSLVRKRNREGDTGSHHTSLILGSIVSFGPGGGDYRALELGEILVMSHLRQKA